MTQTKKMLLAAVSGLLLTGAFPKIGWDWLIWFALLPLLYALKDLPARSAFRMGFITGLIHFLSLLYWLVPVMRTYGYLPAYLSVTILFLFAAVLAVFTAAFSAGLAGRFREKFFPVSINDSVIMGGAGICPFIHIFRVSVGVIGLFPV